ncbi:gamma-glutamylcyclotransferase [Chelatococcus reniformis]|uniref:glutathione-specific gamma-glutamylcyclotransferase n=1 Tax=Chelatococcus reniformis TaxID=1494448 RepID=A0A916XBI4_9HYPH|nr:gamma-glutamylcyclotransferase [Chelatococcus reniformis]GGC59564.1 gamma-glutamylcyclotransferase [Chelatococcus reniformis]
MDKPALTRELFESGLIEEIVARDAPALRLLSPEERAASLRRILDARPPGDAWLFGYGSLIWNPMIRTVERRTARIAGWHRAFCLSTTVGRGSPANPGLVLGLDEGGDCTGIAFRLADDDLQDELALLWRREMLAGAYVPRWLDVHDPDGVRFGSAIAFTIDPAGHHYAGGLALDIVIHRLATASGALGSAADYLFRTCEGLRAHGVSDPALEGLAARVRAMQIAGG